MSCAANREEQDSKVIVMLPDAPVASWEHRASFGELPPRRRNWLNINNLIKVDGARNAYRAPIMGGIETRAIG